MCGDWHQAEDVVQNVFIKLYSAWGRIQRKEAAGLPPQATRSAAGLLQAADLGEGWVYAPDSAEYPGRTLPLNNNGCDDTPAYAETASVGFGSGYTGTLPSGQKTTVTEVTYPVVAGQGPATIAALRAGAEQRCSQQTGRPAVTPLPASAGATGFVQSWSGGGQGYVQVGDTILLVRVRYGAGDGTQQGVPDAMTPADVGLVTVAKQAATRAAAATGKG